MVGAEDREEYKAIVQLMGADVLKLVKLSIADWVIESFQSDMMLQTSLLCVYQMLGTAPAVVQQKPGTVYDRAARR